MLGGKVFVGGDHEEVLVVFLDPLVGEQVGIVGVQDDDYYDAVLEEREILGEFSGGVVVVVEGHARVGIDYAGVIEEESVARVETGGASLEDLPDAVFFDVWACHNFPI